MPVCRHTIRKSTLAIAALVALGASPIEELQAASCTWVPATGNWSSAGNWSCGVVPTGPANDSATIGATKTVTVDSAQSIFTLSNAGTINIDAFLLTLQAGGSTTNSGVINIGGPSTAALQMSNDINNAGGVINIANGSFLNQFSNTITGGTINTTGTGSLVAFNSGSSFLNGVTLNGTMDMTQGNARQRLTNSVTVNGSVNISNGGILSLDSGNSAGGNQTLGGNATINLNDAGARLAIDGTGTTTLGAGVVVRGQGNIGAALNTGGNNVLTNNGLISADVSGGTLNIVAPASGGGSSVINNGTLQAINGGTLLLSTNINSNSGSQIIAGAGSTVVQSSVKLNGVINVSGTGSFQANNSAANFLDGVTFTGALDMTSQGNSRERIINSATINGAVNIANGGILSLDSASGAADQTISGNVVINLNDAGARLAIDGTGTTTLGANVVVRGQGNIGQAINTGGNIVLTNNGLISADVSGGTLNIVAPASGGGSSVINNGTLQAINGGTLLLSTNINSNSGSQIIAGAGSTVVQSGVKLNGVINVSGTGSFQANNSGANFLDGVTYTGALDMTQGNARERIINSATVNGAINIANGGILSLDSASGAANQTLSGNVVINLNDAGARLAIDGTGTTTLGANVVVRGQGNIGQAINTGGNNVLTNNGLISANVNGGTLNIVAPASGGGSSFVNNGTLQAINGGTLLLSTNINSNSGSQIIAGAGSTVVQSGVKLNGVINVSGTGSFQANNSGANFLDGVTYTGALDMTQGNARERIINGATVNGAINIANGGILSLDSTNTAGANQIVSGNVTINLNDPGARLAIDGTGATTLGAGVVVRGQGDFGTAINTGGNNALVSNGLISADVAGGTLNIAAPASGGGSTFTNVGTMQAAGGGTLQLSTSINNSGLITAQSGSTVLQNSVSINGGSLTTLGTGVFQATASGSNFLNGVNLAGTLDLATLGNSRERIINGATINGVVNVANGGILSLDSANTAGNSQTLAGNVTINLNDPGARVSVDGTGTTTLASTVTIRGQGNIGAALNTGGNNTLTNNGLILADGGTLTLASPASGGGSVLNGSGTLQANGGALVLSTATDSTQGRLVIGGAGSTVNLGTTNLIINADYTNAQSGSGNAFDRRAGVSGTGKILAGADAAQVVTGTGVSNGGTANATLTLANVRVGATTFNYQIADVGNSGPTLRGAIQTNVNGASLTDARLSGSGVTAGNYSTGGVGNNTGNLSVVFTAANAGALAPLTGQVLNLTSNFENIADQKLNIVLGANAAAYNVAAGSAVSPVQVANQRVGGSNTAAVTVANTTVAGAFSEDLNVAVGGTTGVATGSGSITGRLAGTNNTGAGAVTVAVDTTTSGARTGTVTLNYQTAGTVNGVSNGLAAANVGSQAVTVNGNVYQAAAGAIQTVPLNFGTVQVGQAVSQALVIRNTANGAAGFVEDLNASFGASSGASAALISGAGSLAGILAGTNSNAGNGTMTVNVNTAAAGAVAGSIAVNFATAGAVNGVSNGLGTAFVGSQGYGVSGLIQAVGNVINQASPVVNNPTINLGSVRMGAASPTALVSVTNQATVAPQAALNASIASNGAPITASGGFNLLAPGATNASALQVGLVTTTAGNFTGANAGSATISLVSDASNVGGCAPNCQLTLASQQVSVSGKVYAPAVAQLNTAAVDFGIVHFGDVVATRGVSVTNAAGATALNDVLTGSFSGATGPFTASGVLAGVAAQAGNATTFQAGLGTGSAGVFSGTATATFLSHNADMADLSLGSSAVTLTGQVNNYAQAAIAKTGGTASLTKVGNVYTLDFGNILLGGADASDTLKVFNSAAILADLLRGSFDTSGLGSEFLLNGFSSFAGLGAGAGVDGFGITLDSANAGNFTETLVLHSFGSNASGYDAALADTTLILHGDVLAVAPVPEPETYALLLAGLLMTAGAVRSRRSSTPRRGA